MIETPAPALCAVHPDQPSIGTCERCGRFLCAGCRAGGGRLFCRECSALLTGAEAVQFKPFTASDAVSGGLALLGATFGRVLLANVPFAIAAAIASALITRATGAAGTPVHGSSFEILGRVYGATLLLTVYSALVTVVGLTAGIALMSEASAGRRLGVVEAWRRAFAVWGRAALASLAATGQTFVYSLACGIPGIWRLVVLSLTNVSVLVAPHERPLAHSESMVQPRFWPVFGALCLGALVVVVPIDVVVMVLGVVLRVKFLPAGAAAAISGFGSEFGRALFCAFPVAIFYGIRASESAQR